MTDIATNFTDNIGMNVDAAYLNGLGAAVNANTHAQSGYGTYASMPSASTCAGQIYFCSDTDAVYRSDGSSWTKIRINGQTSTALSDPTGSGWTTIGSPTSLTADLDGRLLVAPSTGANSLVGEMRTLSPTSNYTATAYFDFAYPKLAPSPQIELGLTLSDGTKYITFGPGYTAGYSYFFGVFQYSNRTTWQATAANPKLVDLPESTFPRWCRIRDNATNRYYEFSYNGSDWTPIYSETRTSYLTATQIGWTVNNQGTGVAFSARLRSFKIA